MLNLYIIFKINYKCKIKSKNSLPFIIKPGYILKFKSYINL
jgi:hypothetical protein